MKTKTFLSWAIALLISMTLLNAQDFDPDFIDTDAESGKLSLSTKGASHFAGLALHCMQVEYPNKLSHVMWDETEVRSPRELHPAFYGCFDWHSSVHGHWMLVRLLRRFPDMPESEEIRKKLNENLSKANLLAEAAYLYQKGRKSFERMYGWSWLLKLAEELKGWEDEDAQRWAENLEPVTDAIVARYIDFLPRQTYPIRVGTHTNTAFGMSFAYDFAVSMENEALRDVLEQRARDYFASDYDCPARWEPGGADFLSPCLEEANLMRKIMPEDEFRPWLKAFLPGLEMGEPAVLMTAATVSDRTDPQIVHLDGVNLSRGWCLQGIASVLPEKDPARKTLIKAAGDHVLATLPHIASGNYEGEHWLASFAVYTLSEF